MDQAGVRLSALETLIADPSLYEDARRAERIATLAKHGTLTASMDDLEMEWLTLQEELEALISA